jgi:parallel beta-helix repeat protein
VNAAGGDGIYAVRAHELRISGCTVRASGGNGIKVERCGQFAIEGNTVQTAVAYGILTQASAAFGNFYPVIRGNAVFDAALSGIFIQDAMRALVAGNVSALNNTGGSANHGGIVISGANIASNRNNVNGNQCYGNALLVGGYGVRVSNDGLAPTNTMIVGNQLGGNFSGAIGDDGTDTVIAANQEG